MARSCAISQSNYIPWKGFFDQINMVDEFVIYDSVQYTRRDWRNRNLIKTARGPQWLTIPMEVKGMYFAAIKDMQIADPLWAGKHWNAIKLHYSNAPYFSDFKDDLQTLYQDAKSFSLSEINKHFLDYVCGVLEIKTRISDSNDYELVEDRNMRLVHICQQLNATEYVSGPRAKGYLDEQLFNDHGITVTWIDYSGYPEYEQMYPPFEQTVSVIDLLLNQGPDARKYMKTFDSVLAR